MPNEQPPVIVPFNNAGLVTQTEPSALQAGQYAELKNLISTQEGSLTTRKGNQLLTHTNAFAGGTQSYIHTIAKLTISTSDDTQNPRYIGALGELFRSHLPTNLYATGAPWTFDLIANPVADAAAPYNQQRIGAVRYAAGSTGTPWIFFACQKKMLKDNGSIKAGDPNSGDGVGGTVIQRWGILPPTRPATVAIVGSGNLNGLYDYVYTYVNTNTGATSNPSVLMVQQVVLTNQSVTITVIGTLDPQVPNSNGAIRIYRAGGDFADGLYRLVGTLANPGASLLTFTDNQPDFSLEFADVAEFDNDPPVTSTLPTPIVLVFGGWTVNGGANAYSIANYTVASGPADPSTILPPGSTVTVAPDGTQQETARIVSWPSPGKVQLFLQYAHTDLSFGSAKTLLMADAATGSPCNLAVAAFDSIFLAGDPNNPHVLYKSKTGRPESFPVMELATGIVCQINVGSPSDPIIAITEFAGGIVCLNESTINFVRVFEGVMQAPVQTPAQRGLVSNGAWCKADQEIWYLAYDGIYSWSGNLAQKRSQRIEQFFHVDGVIPDYTASSPNKNPRPLDFANAKYVTFAYHNSCILASFIDLDFYAWRFRYDTIYDRWSVDSAIYILGVAREAITAQYQELDTGALIVAASSTTIVGGVPGTTTAYLKRDDLGDTDNWLNNPHDGTFIDWAETSAGLTLGAPSLQKQFQDYILELNNDSDLTANQTYTRASFFYDFSAAPDSLDLLNIGPNPTADGRKRVALPLQNGWGKEAYALQVRLYGQGPVTLYSQTVNWIPLEQTQAGRAFDWDDLGYPWDKKLRTITVEYDTSSGYTIPLNLDIMQGVTNAQHIIEAYQSFQLPAPTGTFKGPSHVKINFPINDGTICKKVRLRPDVESVTDPTSFHRFKVWPTYLFDFEKYPEDIVYFTPWNTFGYPYEKGLRNLTVEVNSGGVPLQIQLQGDGGVVFQTWTVTTTLNDRIRVLTVTNENLFRQARLVFIPGPGGMAQVFNWTGEIIKEPPYVTYWSSYEQDFGILGWRWIRKAWIDYYGTGGLTVQFYREDRVLFYSVNLPAHSNRDEETFYLPPGISAALNKSRLHSVDTIPADGTTPFKLYPNTQLEIVPIGSDQRQGAVQVKIAEPMQPLGGV